MEDEHIIYLIDESQFKRLRQIEKALFGDGSHLTPDGRRDIANKCNVILNEIETYGKVPHQRPRR